MEQQISFCTSFDGTRIAYATLGQGQGFALVMVPDWCVNLESDWRRPEGRAFWETLAQGRRLVSYDRRGVGASQREVEDISLEAQVADLVAVVDHLELERFDLWGSVDGATVAVAYAAQHPQRVSRLVLWSPYSDGEALSHPEPLRSLQQFITGRWPLATEAIADIAFPSGPIEAQEWATASLRESISPKVAAKYLEFECSVDIRAYLPQVQAPTLVLHRRGARDIPIAQGKAAAALLPDARFVALEGDIAYPYFNHGQYIDLVTQFLVEAAGEALPKSPRGLAVAYTDGLTRREVEVLRLVAAGKSSREIGQELVLSVRTVERHITNIYRKIKAHGRAQAIAYALTRGVIESPLS